MNDSDNASGTKLFDNPEIQQLFHSVFSTLVVESDRGAVLIGASHVDLHLRNLFETLAPRLMSKRELRRVLDYPGPLSSLSAKADIALITRLISDNLHGAIHHLRRIRNEVAHTPDSFNLKDHEQRLRKMYELVGPDMPSAINDLAWELIRQTAIRNLLEAKDPTSDKGEPLISDPQEALTFLEGDSETRATLEERRPRYELAWGVGLICGLIVFHRDRAKEVLGDNNAIAVMARKEEHHKHADNA